MSTGRQLSFAFVTASHLVLLPPATCWHNGYAWPSDSSVLASSYSSLVLNGINGRSQNRGEWQKPTQLKHSTQVGIDMVFYIALVVINAFVSQELACEQHRYVHLMLPWRID
ncbi:MAG: hypothetical protein DRQ59_13100 [Gammaproteobacteria bacterium]|nr:MAG: hypothetical protein DRQ59_13100 [Gammaproteobacteria bacterium]